MEPTRARRARKLRLLWIAMTALGALGAGMAADASLAYAQPKPEPRFVLSGVVIDDAGAARALLAEPQWTQGQSAIFVVGDMVGPYRVVNVAPDHVVLEQPGEPPLRVLLTGSSGGESAVSSPPPAAAPAPGGGVPAEVRMPRSQRRESRPQPSEEEKSASSSPPADTGKPVYRPAWEGPSTAGPRAPAFDADDFRRQLQQHLKGAPAR